MNGTKFGQIIAYLAVVYLGGDSYDKETHQKALRKTVEDFQVIDLPMYKRNNSFLRLLGSLFR